MTATAVRCGRCDPDWFAVRFAYDPRVVEMVKTVQAGFRDYEHETRTWFVHLEHVVALACDLVALGYPVVGLNPFGPDAVTAVCDDCGKPVTFVRAPAEGTT